MKELFLNIGGKITLQDVELLSKRLDISFPEEYKNFLVDINGGTPKNVHLELRVFDSKETNTNIYVRIENFFHFDQLEEIWDYTCEDLCDLKLFPIASVEGGMFICCKQLESQLAEIIFYDSNFGYLELTSSLSELIQTLLPKEHVNYRKYGFNFSYPGE